MTLNILPHKSVPYTCAKFVVVGKCASTELGAGIISYHEGQESAADNASAINQAGGKAHVLPLRDAVDFAFTSNKRVSHYRWLEKHLDTVWHSIFNMSLKDSMCGGIIVAHGDKCYGYRTKWGNAGIPFAHGVALYFLTYTELVVREDVDAQQWVIDNYTKYRPFLADIVFDDPDTRDLFARD